MSSLIIVVFMIHGIERFWFKDTSFVYLLLFTEKLWSKANPFKGIKKEHIPYFKPPYCRGTDN